jgi:ADP-ribose pyrophosphatase YjhB (NUDIX family)
MIEDTLSETHMNEAALKGNILAEKRIRVIALGIFRQGDEIFVVKGFDPIKSEYFYRPLGGGINFGETGSQALVREMYEETGLLIEKVRYLGTCENIFTYMGEKGHEIALIYIARFIDPAVYDADEVECAEDDETPFTAVWKHLDSFGKGKDGPLYPNGLMELLEGTGRQEW